MNILHITSNTVFFIIFLCTHRLAYAQSKLANILFSNELARRTQLSGSGITANCLHPGFIKTDLARHIHTQIDSLGEALAFLAKLGEHWLFSAAMEADDGALTQVAYCLNIFVIN